MATFNQNPFKSIQKKSKRGYHGHPIATVAFYGFDDKTASKVAVGIIKAEGAEAENLKRWVSEEGDVRGLPNIAEELLQFIKENQVKSVVTTDRIIGCPHEEGKDYPSGEECPRCPFWQGRNRWSGRREL